MKRGVVLPGSTLGEEESVAATAGRLSAEDVVTLAQVAVWWRYRLARADAADPTASLLGGVDAKGTATTNGTVSAPLTLSPPLVIPPNTGCALLLHAYGQPTGSGPTGVYSLLAVAHFYNDPTTPTAVATLITRLPASATTIDLVAAVTPGTNALVFSLTGVSGLTIEWTADVYSLT